MSTLGSFSDLYDTYIYIKKKKGKVHVTDQQYLFAFWQVHQIVSVHTISMQRFLWLVSYYSYWCFQSEAATWNANSDRLLMAISVRITAICLWTLSHNLLFVQYPSHKNNNSGAVSSSTDKLFVYIILYSWFFNEMFYDCIIYPKNPNDKMELQKMPIEKHCGSRWRGW